MPAGVGGTGVEHLGNARVVHQGQGLALGLEAGDHLVGIQTRLDDLQGHLSPNGSLLLGHVDDTHAPFPDLLQSLVGADVGASDVGQSWLGWDNSRGHSRVGRCGRLQPEDRFDRRGVIGEASVVLARVDSFAAIRAQLQLECQQLAEEGGPLRLVGLGQKVLDSRLAFGPPLRLEPLTYRIDAPRLRRRQFPKIHPSAPVHLGPPLERVASLHPNMVFPRKAGPEAV